MFDVTISPNRSWDHALWWFGWYSEPLPEKPPNWFTNPFSEAPQPDSSKNWWFISDFDAGDIKGLWELSRFDWLVAWATTAALGDTFALNRINTWLEDWSQSNPLYRGPNWKCGQEASIRVMHLITAAWVLRQDEVPEKGLVDLLTAHLQRIAPTMSYAIGQQNNHGVSEAAALFIGGSFLANFDPRADAWARKGRYWLEERATRLIKPDGSFSQYSTSYHRVMLDCYSLSEAWRKHRDLPAFSNRLHSRLGSATDWLWTLTDPKTGDAPNIGANDGSRLLQLTGSDYRDFRPSVQLAAALFREADAFGAGPWVTPLRWLGTPDGDDRTKPQSRSFDDGGYHVLRRDKAMAVLRYPRFTFRPSQSDALHLDLWYNGVDLLRDAGTFSYNSEGAAWFSDTSAHNTIEFDGRNQMPRLGRFLFGDWLKAEAVEPVHHDGNSLAAAAAYTDGEGARHHREILLKDSSMICLDTISGTFEKACLRWRLAPGNWYLRDNTVRSDDYSVSIEIDGAQASPILENTAESRYYQHQSEVPLISVNVDGNAKSITKIITKVTF